MLIFVYVMIYIYIFTKIIIFEGEVISHWSRIPTILADYQGSLPSIHIKCLSTAYNFLGLSRRLHSQGQLPPHPTA